MRNSQINLPGQVSVIITFKYTNHFSLKLSSFGELKFTELLGCFVCVYDQNYALVIVTQPKNEEFTNKFTRISQCNYLIQIYRTIFL